MPHPETKANRALQAATFDAVIATEYPVPRDYGAEVLACTPDAIDLSRFPLPVLVLHNAESLPIGVARNPVITNGQLRAEVFLNDSEAGLQAGSDIADGVLNHVSVGYQIAEVQPTEDGRRATKWAPYEVSLVSVPADPNARISQRGKRTMETNQTPLASDNAKVAAELFELGQRHGMEQEAIEAVRNGASIESFRAKVLERIGSKGAFDPIGLSSREADGFSFTRAIVAQATGDWSKAGLEREVLRATEGHATRSNSFVIPVDVLRRDLTTVGASAAVGVEHMPSSFIDFLHTRSDVLARCTMMSGLSGDVSIPRLTASSSAGWYTEQGSITQSTPTFDAVTLSPEVLAGMVSYSRKMMAQSQPNVENIVRRDLATVLGLELDRAVINGSGSGNEPLGILNTTGIGDVAIGTDGGTLLWSHLVSLIEQVASANADSSGVFVVNSATEAFLRATPRIAATDGRLMLESTEGIAGRELLVSNNVPANLTKGTGTGLSALLYGDLSQVLVGSWGGLEVVVDPYTELQTSTIRLAAFYHVDIALRHPESFAAILDADVSL